MSNFQKYIGTYVRTFPGIDLTAAPGAVYDFGVLPVPPSYFQSDAGPATGVFDNAVTVPGGTPSPPTGIYAPKLALDLESDFGAATDGTSSVQSQLQAAVTALVAAGGGRLTLRNRVYNFDSINWPQVGMDQSTVTIEIVGPVMPNTVPFCPGDGGFGVSAGSDMLPPSSGAILKPSLASGSGFGGSTSVNNLMPIFRNLIIRCPTNPQWHAIDCGFERYLVTEGVVVDTGRSYGDGSNPLSPGPIVQPTNAGVYGIVYPGGGNGGVVRARDVSISGFYNGFLHSEHYDGDRITTFKCMRGQRVRDGFHAARIGRISHYWNATDIAFVRLSGGPNTPLQIDELDTEETTVTSNWFSTTYHIDDPNNWGRGRIAHHRMIPATGSTPVLRRRGGVKLNLSATTELQRATVDAVGFEAADSTTTPTASLAGAPFSALRGTWGISSQQMYLPTRSGTNLGDLIVWDVGTNQVEIRTRVTIPSTMANSNLGIALCAVDASNYLLCAITKNGAGSVANASIQKVTAGTFANLAAATSTGQAMANSQSYDLRVILQGKRIAMYLDGALVRSYTLSSGEWTTFGAGTAHGAFAWSGSGSAEDGTSRWDRFEIKAAGPVAQLV